MGENIITIHAIEIQITNVDVLKLTNNLKEQFMGLFQQLNLSKGLVLLL
jgi:hypothetical protein